MSKDKGTKNNKKAATTNGKKTQSDYQAGKSSVSSKVELVNIPFKKK